jgi:hypothetical protein
MATQGLTQDHQPEEAVMHGEVKIVDADFDTIFGDLSIDVRQHLGRYVSIDGVMVGQECDLGCKRRTIKKIETKKRQTQLRETEEKVRHELNLKRYHDYELVESARTAEIARRTAETEVLAKQSKRSAPHSEPLTWHHPLLVEVSNLKAVHLKCWATVTGEPPCETMASVELPPPWFVVCARTIYR